jgi:tetratricopeptide (TPR) repeat protein
MLYNNLGISLFLKGDYEEAVSAFKEALTLENSNKKILTIGPCLSKLERYEETFEASKKTGDGHLRANPEASICVRKIGATSVTGQCVFVVMNKYPSNNGHLIIPNPALLKAKINGESSRRR